MLASNLAGVCCAAGIPTMEMHHHGMMSADYVDGENALQVQPFATHCQGEAAQNVSFSDRDLDRGCTDQRLYRGMNLVPIDYLPAISIPSNDQTAPMRYFKHGCGFHGISPPRVQEQSSGNQLLF